MDRDVAISMTTALTNIKNILNTLATNTTPTTVDNRSVSLAENQRSVPAEDPEEEPEAPVEEPETRTKK